jgi:hypothetical protein
MEPPVIALIVNLNVLLKDREQFEKIVEPFYIEKKFNVVFLYDLDSLREKIICLCKKNYLKKTTIFYYGNSDDTIKVSATRRFLNGIILPTMITTATSNTLELSQIKFMRSIPFTDQITNFRNVNYVQEIENNIIFLQALPIQTDETYKQDLVGAFLLKNPIDVITTKETPNPEDTRVTTLELISPEEASTKQWIYADLAISQFYKLPTKNFTFTGKFIDENIVQLTATSKDQEFSINTTVNYLEAAGVLTDIAFPEAMIVAQNQDEIWINLTKQLLLGYFQD